MKIFSNWRKTYMYPINRLLGIMQKNFVYVCVRASANVCLQKYWIFPFLFIYSKRQLNRWNRSCEDNVREIYYCETRHRYIGVWYRYTNRSNRWVSTDLVYNFNFTRLFTLMKKKFNFILNSTITKKKKK